MTSNALKFTSKGQVIVEVTVVSSRLDGVSNMLVDQSEADWDFDLLDDGVCPLLTSKTPHFLPSKT